MAKKAKKAKKSKAKWKLPPWGKNKPAKAKKARKAKARKPATAESAVYMKPSIKEVANPWHPVTDPAPEGQVLEINGEYDRKPELAVKTNGVWRAHVEGKKTKPVATMAPVEVAAPRRWRLRAPK